MNFDEPFLVLGAGRCGTSFVARVLHEHGIAMTQTTFSPDADDNNPFGYYEDQEISRLNQSYISNEINRPHYMRSLADLMNVRAKSGWMWGIKDPLFAEPSCFRGLLNLCMLSRVIWCQRARKDIIASYTRCYEGFMGSGEVARMVDRRLEVLRELRHRDGVLRINFDREVFTDTLRKRLKQKWPEVFDGRLKYLSS